MKSTDSFLDWVGGVVNLTITERFVVREKFVVNTRYDAPVKISGIDWRFIKWFGDVVEEPSGSVNLCRADFPGESTNRLILKAIGKPRWITKPSQLYTLMSRQPKGEVGELLDDFSPNLFYMESEVFDESERNLTYENEDGRLVIVRTVHVHWAGDGWFVFARRVEDERSWDLDGRVFAHD